MRKIQELFTDNTRIGEVDIHPDDHIAQTGIREAAEQAGLPVRHFARLALSAEMSELGPEAQASQLAPTIARWITQSGVNMVLSPGHLSAHLSHRVAERAIVRAAMQAVSETNETVTVLAAHGAETAQGSWIIEPDQRTVPSYTRLVVNPGILLSESAESHFA